VPSLGRSRSAKLLAAMSAVGLLLSPAIAAPAKNKKEPAVAVSFDPLSTFTPAGADPKLAASVGSRGLSLTDFKFTPAAAKSRPSQIRVAIRARPDAARARVAEATSASPVTALTPASYNLGAAVGWRRFAVSGDVAKMESRNPAIGNKESAVVGVSYSLKRFTGRVAVGAERDERVPALRDRENYSLDVGGEYSISRRLAVTGGVRSNVERDRNAVVQDNRRDSQAVYVGTAFKF
jgi:Gram-negative porin